jgi:G:T-mismatch repair DNA endonuclease (very short patch repair protein)
LNEEKGYRKKAEHVVPLFLTTNQYREIIYTHFCFCHDISPKKSRRSLFLMKTEEKGYREKAEQVVPLFLTTNQYREIIYTHFCFCHDISPKKSRRSLFLMKTQS